MLSAMNPTTTKGGSGIGSVPTAMPGVTKPSRTKTNSPPMQSDMSIISTRSNWIRLHLLFCFLASPMLCPGQVVQSARFELPLAATESGSYWVISVEEKGVILYRRAITNNNQMGMDIVRLDTALKAAWKGFIPIDKNMVIEQASTSQNNLFILLRDPGHGVENFQVLAIN